MNGSQVNHISAAAAGRIRGHDHDQAVSGEVVTLNSLLELLERTPGLAMITDLSGHLLYMNASGRRTLGLDRRADLADHTIFDDYSEQSRDLIRSQAIPLALRDGAWRGEATLIDRQERELPVSQVIVFHHTPEQDVLLSIAWDMREQKMREHSLWHRATHDALTGLPNRALLVDRLTHEIRAGSRNGQQTAVLFVDMDRFKFVNDELGHETANELLVEVAARLRACARSADTVSRYGGDEFVLVLGGLKDSSAVERVTRRIHDAMAEPFAIGGQQIYLTASVGVALHPFDGEDASSLLDRADMQMYRDKRRHGRARGGRELRHEVRQDH